MRRLGSRYILDERIGKGAQGEVWIGRASSESSQDTVPEVYAFKILRTDLAEEPGFVERFIKERSTLLRVSSPYVIGVHDFVVEGTTLALVMDYVPGGDLRGYLKESGPLPPAEAAQLGASVAEGLSAVHSAGILHRDVKPANILLDFSTTPMTPRVVDFGIARIIDVAGASHLTGVIGTPLYMSPEVLSGEVPGPQADIYSLGVVLYEVVCGVTPFVGSISELLGQHMHRTPGRPAGVPDRMWGLIASMLVKTPEKRPTATDVARELRAMASELENVPAAPKIAKPPPSTPSTELADGGVSPTAGHYPQAAFASASQHFSASSPTSYIPNRSSQSASEAASSYAGPYTGPYSRTQTGAYGSQTQTGAYGSQTFPFTPQTAGDSRGPRRSGRRKKWSKGTVALVSLLAVALVGAGVWGIRMLMREEKTPEWYVANLPAGKKFVEEHRISKAYKVAVSPDRSLVAANVVSDWTLYSLSGTGTSKIAKKSCYDNKSGFWNNSSFLCHTGSSATVIRSNGNIYRPPGPSSHNLVGTDGEITVMIADNSSGDLVGIDSSGKEAWRALGKYSEAIVQNGFILSYDNEKKSLRILSVASGEVLKSVDAEDDFESFSDNPHPLGFGIDAGTKAFYRIESGSYTIWDEKGERKFGGKAKVTTNNWVISSPNVSPEALKELFEASPATEAVNIRGESDIRVAKVDGAKCRIEIDGVRFKVPKVNDQSRCYVDILGLSGDDDTLLLESSNASDERRRWKTGTVASDNEGKGKVVAYSLSNGNELWRADGSFVALLGGNRMAIRPNGDEIILGTVRDE